MFIGCYIVEGVHNEDHLLRGFAAALYTVYLTEVRVICKPGYLRNNSVRCN